MTGALRGEWTKLRSVPRWIATLLGAAVLTIGLGALGASASNTDINRNPDFVTGPYGDPVADGFGFAHHAVTGDTSVTVHVTSLAPANTRPSNGGPRPGHGSAVDAVERPGRRSHAQGRHRPGLVLRVRAAHRVPRGSDAVRLHARRRGQRQHGRPVVAPDSHRGRGHRIRVRRRTDLEPDRHHDPECRPRHRGDRYVGVLGPHPLRGAWHGLVIARGASGGCRRHLRGRGADPVVRHGLAGHGRRNADPGAAEHQGRGPEARAAGRHAAQRHLHGRRPGQGRPAGTRRRRGRGRTRRSHRRPDGPDLHRGAVRDLGVPARHDPHDVRGHPSQGPGAGGQGARPRRRHLRDQPVRRGGLVPRGGAHPAGPRHGPTGVPDAIADRPTRC